MAISYNTGATTTKTGVAHTVQPTLTVPAGVTAGDLLLVSISVFTFTPTSPDFTLTATSGNTWTAVGHGVQNSGASGGVNVLSKLWTRQATGTDAGDTLTLAFTGTQGSTDQFWWCVSVDAWHGAGAVDVVATPATGTSAGTGTITQPGVNTLTAGDWELDILAAGINSSGTLTVAPSGKTLRENANTAGIVIGVSDSNASMGAAGTSLGGGSYTASNSSFGWWVAWTLGISPAVPAVPAVTPPSILEHPRWREILAASTYRRSVAPAAASLRQQHWRLMDGVNGRPGNGPGTATGSGTNVNGTGFYVTQGGMWFEGYWWWVAAAGGQSTSPQKFALWTCTSAGIGNSAVVPGSVVTSGTLSPGWNFIPLPQPIPLAIAGQYEALTGLTGTYPATAGQFSTNGLVNGPLAAFSDTGGNNPAPYSYGNGVTSSASADPTVTQPTGDSGTGANYWLDVQVTNVAPAGYSGSYRLWPNMADADFSTLVDSSVSYVLATEVVLSQPCVINAIWYYRPSATVQLATSADIWRLGDQVRVATNPTPTWTIAGGGKAPTAGGQWVRCEMPGVTLPAGRYRFSVYNGNGSPDGWSAKRLGYWQAVTAGAGGTGAADGTYQHGAPGANGITCGPLYAPTTPLASAATDYATSNTEPGQSTFAVGPPNQFPSIYVGASPSGIYTGPALFQNYWIDVEVTPAATFQPDAPVLPQRIPHPLWFDLAEDYALRRISGNAAHGTVRQVTAALTVTSTVTAGALPAKTAGTTRTVTATVTATATVTRARGATRTVTATRTAAAAAVRHRSAGVTTTATITAGPTKSGASNSAGARPTVTVAVTATATTVRHRAATRTVTATVTATAKVTRHRSATRTVTVTTTVVSSGGATGAAVSVHVAVTAQVTRTPAAGPPAPPAPQQRGSWWQLLDIREQARQEFDYYAERPPVACPRDGEPLRNAPALGDMSGVELFCRFCGWQYPRDWVRPERL